MAAPGIVLVKQMQYRGAPEEWSNKYHFVGSAPSDSAGWDSLRAALVTLEKALYGGWVKIVAAYGYDDTDHDATYVYHYAAGSEPTGTITASGTEVGAPGDAAAWVRWKTARNNSRGRPIYLRKYFHGVTLAGAFSGDSDAMATEWISAATSFAGSVNATSGAWPGIAGPDGVAPGASSVSTYITTRTLKRRGPRP